MKFGCKIHKAFGTELPKSFQSGPQPKFKCVVPVEPLGPPLPAAGCDRSGQVVKYSVRFEHDKKVVREFSESEMIGPGFASVTSSKLKHDQVVYVTHNNREFQGLVRYHRPNIDQVIIQLVSRDPIIRLQFSQAFFTRSKKKY